MKPAAAFTERGVLNPFDSGKYILCLRKIKFIGKVLFELFVKCKDQNQQEAWRPERVKNKRTYSVLREALRAERPFSLRHCDQKKKPVQTKLNETNKRKIKAEQLKWAF